MEQEYKKIDSRIFKALEEDEYRDNFSTIKKLVPTFYALAIMSIGINLAVSQLKIMEKK